MKPAKVKQKRHHSPVNGPTVQILNGPSHGFDYYSVNSPTRIIEHLSEPSSSTPRPPRAERSIARQIRRQQPAIRHDVVNSPLGVTAFVNNPIHDFPGYVNSPIHHFYHTQHTSLSVNSPIYYYIQHTSLSEDIRRRSRDHSAILPGLLVCHPAPSGAITLTGKLLSDSNATQTNNTTSQPPVNSPTMNHRQPADVGNVALGQSADPKCMAPVATTALHRSADKAAAPNLAHQLTRLTQTDLCARTGTSSTGISRQADNLDWPTAKASLRGPWMTGYNTAIRPLGCDVITERVTGHNSTRQPKHTELESARSAVPLSVSSAAGNAMRDPSRDTSKLIHLAKGRFISQSNPRSPRITTL